MATVTVQLTKEEIDQALVDFAADKLGMTGEGEAKVRFTLAGKKERSVSSATVVMEKP